MRYVFQSSLRPVRYCHDRQRAILRAGEEQSVLIVQNKLGHGRLVDLDLLDSSLVGEGISQDMNGTRQVRI